ncbi:MAG TPA: LamG domain-containing protein [Candidatus Krumholzibacteria bacterium]|nr:LamG domain-containing protein [Candidatus Krumholzibacteria bacterium]
MTTLTKLSVATMSLLVFGLACSKDSVPLTSPQTLSSQSVLTSNDDALLLMNFNNDLIDESKYHRPVSFVGTEEYRKGCDDNAIMFEGNEYAQVPASTSLQPDNVTVEVWMSPKHALASDGSFYPLVVKYAGNFWNTVDGYDMWYQDSGGGGRVGFGIGTKGGTLRLHASLTTVLEPSKLYHIVGTYDGQYARLYLNGDEVAATPYADGLAYLGAGIRIGGGVYHSYYGGYQYYRGLIDEVAIFPRALSADEVRSRYHTCELFVLNQSGSSDKDRDVPTEP